MTDINKDQLIHDLAKVLKANDQKLWTAPAANLYPHQWLWDSCFIAIGLRHLDIDRAKTELKSLLRGQWDNGMLPNMILTPSSRDREIEKAYLSPYSPHDIDTSGLTQPPMLAEAVVKVGQKMRAGERRTWYKQMYPALLRYHQWLYAERDPHAEGLIILVHPYESGLDNSPVWISELRKHGMPWWVKAVDRLRLSWLINLFRRDTHFVDPSQRMANADAAAYWSVLRRLRRHAYNSEAILSRAVFALEDLTFNCIFIRANDCLAQIAKDIGRELPADLQTRIKKTREALDQLWEPQANEYFSRNFVTHRLVEQPTIATFMPLYCGSISHEKAQHLVNQLKRKRTFASNWPVPTVPRNSTFFDPYRYWQGPTWINTNWLIIEGLRRYGFDEDADALRQKTIELVSKSGPYEYFNPLDGSPAGAPNFSWTAALTIDLLKH